MNRPAEQVWIPGIQPADEPDVETVKQAIYLWLNAKVEQRRAGEETKAKHAAMLAALAEAKLEWHPYLDPSTQKKRRVWIAKEPKAKTIGVPKPPKEPKRRGRRGRQAREQDAEILETGDDKVEVRRVPRASVVAEVDPFATIRERMDAKATDAEKKAAELPKGKRGK